MCLRPCWPTPEEAQRLIDAGYGERLMRDYWVRPGDNIWLLCPANSGREGQTAANSPLGRCTFQDEYGLCILHDRGLKPIEGRYASCTGCTSNLHEDVAKTWDNPEAQEMVDAWLNM